MTDSLDFDNLCSEIDRAIDDLAKEILNYDPLSILHRAFWSHIAHNLEPTPEALLSKEQIKSLRIIEFCQNYLASLKQKQTDLPAIDDEGWTRIEALIEKIDNLMVAYFFYRSSELLNKSEKYDYGQDALFTYQGMYWWAVRGYRYDVHEIIHIRELLIPHSDIFEEIFGISMIDFIKEIEKIQYSLTFGIGNAFKELDKFRDESLDKIEKLGILETLDPNNWLQEGIKQAGLKEKGDEIIDRALGMGLCNVSKITNLPKFLLDELSWKEGEDENFWSEGEYAGWSLRVTPMRKRPFINIQGQYYCLNLHNLFDNLYRIVERLILAKKPDYKQKWNKIQQETSEYLPFKYFERLLPKAEVYHSIFYGKKGCRSEMDGLIIYDDVLILLEVKAGSLATTSPVLDYETNLLKLKELIENPANQAQRFRNYLEENKKIDIYDSNKKRSNIITTLDINSFREIFQCCITLDNLGHLASKASKLKSIGINVDLSSTWSLALDDLRVYADLFDSPLQFLHFLKHRSLAEASGLVELNDELEHIAMYFNYNNYAMYAKEIIAEDEVTHIHWHGLTIDIDNYYSNALAEPDKQHEKPKQKFNLYVRQVLDILTCQEKQGRAKVADYILDASDEYRKQIEDRILHSLKRQKELKRIIPIHLFGDLNLSIFCIQKGINNPNIKWKKEYLWSALIAYDYKSTLALDLHFNRNNKIFNIDFTFIDIADIPKYCLDKINQQASEIKHRLIQKSK